MKILITGAHFTPAKAVIEELSKNKDIEIVYIGRKTSMEGDNTPSVESIELPKFKVKYKTLITGRLRRDLDFYTLLSLLKIPIGIVQSFYFILTEKPDVILSFGGYVGVPIIFAGWLFSIPIIIHEQGLVPGLANKISSIFADKICLSFGQARFPKEVLTGIPLRKEILEVKPGPKGKKPLVLITCGNQGSHVINIAIEGCLKKLSEIASVIHQTGDSKYFDYERLKQYQSDVYMPVKWIGDDIGEIMLRADLVVCRSGINTLSEAAYLGIPALTIPIANHSEQNINAKYFEKIGLAKILPQSKLSPEILLGNIKNMLKSKAKRTKDIKDIIIKDAAKRIALETIIFLSS